MTNKKSAVIAGAVFLVILAAIFYYASQLPSQMATPQPAASQPAAPETAATELASYNLAEVALHNTPTDCWAAIDGAVYDLTNWVDAHPGGARAITGLCGRDGTEDFSGQHGGSDEAASALNNLQIGLLNQK